MIGHHGLVALLELDLGGLVRLHPELGDHLGQGHLHLGHGEPLPCGCEIHTVNTSLSGKEVQVDTNAGARASAKGQPRVGNYLVSVLFQEPEY